MMARANFSGVRRRAQRGVALLEALLAVLLLSIGLVGTLALQSRSVAALSESGLRAEAVIAANELLGIMNADADPDGLTAYAVAEGAAPGVRLAAWHKAVSDRIPGAKISVAVTVPPPLNVRDRIEVNIAIKWQRTTDSQANNHRINAYLARFKG